MFRLTGLTISDTVQVVGGIPDPKGALLSFDAPGANFPRPPAVATPGWLTADSFLADARLRQTAWPAFYRDSTARQLAEVVVRAYKRTDERPIEIQRASLHSEADAVVVVDDNNPVFDFQTVASLILSRFPGVQPNGSGFRIHGYSSFGDQTPLYLVDGLNIDEPTALGIQARVVSRIELLKDAGAAMYGARGANGVIAIYTRKGPQESLSAPTSVSATVIGFVTPREFYVPRYDSPEVGSHTDRRDVLFWQPMGQSDGDGQARLVFPLSDVAKRLRLVVEGITAEGLPMSFTWELPVR